MAHQEEEELRGKAKLAFEASLKIFQGRKLATEGTFELNNLFGEHSKKGSTLKKSELTPGQKSALTKKKLIAHRDSSFKKDTRSDETIKKKMVHIVRVNRQASTALLMKKLKLSERRANRMLGQLEGEGVIVNEGNKEDGPHKWVLPKKAKPQKEKKEINGHKLAKTPGGGRGGHKTVPGVRGAQIDVTDERIVNKAKEFLATHDWVNKGQFLDAIDLSPGPGNRLIDYMKKQKLIKEVQKKNNPAHDKHGLRKLFVRPFSYLELA